MEQLDSSRTDDFAFGAGAQSISPVWHRRRSARRPVSLSRLAVVSWRAARPFAPLALFAIVFGLSLGVVQVVESVTPPNGTPPAVSSPAPNSSTSALQHSR